MHGFGRDEFNLARERLIVARPESALADSAVLGKEKGGVVRRPFSMLQAWLIAVSPQPGVALAIGSEPRLLEPLTRDDATRTRQ